MQDIVCALLQNGMIDQLLVLSQQAKCCTARFVIMCLFLFEKLQILKIRIFISLYRWTRQVFFFLLTNLFCQGNEISRSECIRGKMYKYEFLCSLF